MADNSSKTTTPTKSGGRPAVPMSAEDARWFDSLKGVLKLYENTLASSGVIRSQATVGSDLTRVTRLGHARWEIDQLLHLSDRRNDPLYALARFSFIQGILWGENVFPMTALTDHARTLYPA